MSNALGEDIKSLLETAKVNLGRSSPECTKAALDALRKGLSTYPQNYALLTRAKKYATALGLHDEAISYAVQMLKIAPDDERIRFDLCQQYFDFGKFERARRELEPLLTLGHFRALILAARCHLAEHHVDEAIEMLEKFIVRTGDVKLLSKARYIAFQHARFDKALAFGLALLERGANDPKSFDFVANSYIATGDLQAAEQFVTRVAISSASRPLKAAGYLYDYGQLKKTAPALAGAWRCAASNRPLRASAAPHDSAVQSHASQKGVRCRLPLIQYWSQGDPPSDVKLVSREWAKLVEDEGFAEVQVYDRSSANQWIADFAPEFLRSFEAAFHYAMEADIFRIAFASKLPCIYADIDSWPLSDSSRVIRFAVENRATMLCFRSYRPWITNSFFVSQPDSPFWRRLVDQALEVNLSTLAKNSHTIKQTFGPIRYNGVLQELLAEIPSSAASAVGSLNNCSKIEGVWGSLYFTCDSAVASVKPPFPLQYEKTVDSWKNLNA